MSHFSDSVSSSRCNVMALMYLEGKIDPPSMRMDAPEEILDGPSIYYGLWRRNMNLSVLRVSRMEFRENNLSEAEKQVALPRELSNIMRSQRFGLKQERLRQWRKVWARRIEQKEYERRLAEYKSKAKAMMGRHKSTHQGNVQNEPERHYVCSCKSTPSVRPCLYCVPS